MMATNDDPSSAYTPAYDLAISPQEKNKLMVEKDFSIIKTIVDTANKLSQLKKDISEKDKDDLQKGIDAMLKASAYAIANNPDLQERVNLERQGKNSPYEGTLTQLIELSGSNLDQDIEFGLSVPASVRLQWQALGMDPDSENEVQEFLERNGIGDSRQPTKENTNTNKMR
ncbi:hypothetical protein [Candidatus Berkiella aquae]|uniref:Uncharacterized protein n=2 Tax=Candidatus Berkiella aquae TaxID=295108 RepID=A0AAE3HT35_9GAMM|nr:hypothetical protein [Candidatus Berkiella aquae]MCS5710158.1 hypothetical protein [Candidatus Berkiella aquae]